VKWSDSDVLVVAMWLLLLVLWCNSAQWKLLEVHGGIQAIFCCWTEECWGVSGM